MLESKLTMVQHTQRVKIEEFSLRMPSEMSLEEVFGQEQQPLLTFSIQMLLNIGKTCLISFTTR